MTITEQSPATLDADKVRTWLDVLYTDAPGLIHISSTGNWTGRTFDDRDQAAAYVTHLDTRAPEGIYLRATTLRGKPADGKRGGDDDALALPGLWADLDIAGPGHKHEVCAGDCPKPHVHITRALPPDEQAARQIIAESGLPEPTLWVHSGGGMYPWWLLDQAAAVDETNRADLGQLSARWQAVIGRSAAALGWHYGTGVGDLSRILRIPGTINRKEGLARPCQIVDARPHRHTLDELHAGLVAGLARHPDSVAAPVQAAHRRLDVVRAPGHVTPNDDFEARVGWDDALLLGGAGWTIAKGAPGQYCEWVRPGKTTEGISATTGKDPMRDRCYVFSEDAGLPVRTSMTKAHVFAQLHHGGDNRAATRDLAERGFGTALPSPSEEERAAYAELAPRASPQPARQLAAVDGTAVREIAPATKPLDRQAEIAALTAAPEDVRTDLTRDLIRRIAGLDAGERQTWRDAIRRAVPAVSKNDFDEIVRDEQRARREKAKEAKAAFSQQMYEDQKRNATVSEQVIPAPTDPMATARALVERLPSTGGIPHMTWWRGDFYQWTGTRWAVQRDATINQWLYLATEHAVYDSGQAFERWEPNISKIGNLRDAIGSAVLARPWDSENEKCVATTNGVLNLANRTLQPHTPQRFNLASLPFAYDPDATCPTWRTFLDQVLPGDEEAQQFLAEWFGYVVSGRTDLQKIASLFGARRSGKGTIARIMEALLGPESVASVRLAGLSGDFGEQPLIGKSLAVLSDVNWNTRDIGEAVEIMKAISGEDSRDVNRKNRETWHGPLGVRFMVLGNDMPKFTDASGALAGRMIHVRFKVSFYGKEDPTLTGRLMKELPGILNWALDGLDRLTARGRFHAPASSEESALEILRLTSPVYGFIDDHAVLNPEAHPILLDDLFAVYKEWCADEEGRDHVSTKAVFARDLRSAGNGAIRIERQMVDNVRAQRVYGLAPAETDGFKPKNRWLTGAS